MCARFEQAEASSRCTWRPPLRSWAAVGERERYPAINAAAMSNDSRYHPGPSEYRVFAWQAPHENRPATGPLHDGQSIKIVSVFELRAGCHCRRAVYEQLRAFRKPAATASASVLNGTRFRSAILS
jgi:hypothetical protein